VLRSQKISQDLNSLLVYAANGLKNLTTTNEFFDCTVKHELSNRGCLFKENIEIKTRAGEARKVPMNPLVGTIINMLYSDRGGIEHF
jgi:hypothetical protein